MVAHGERAVVAMRGVTKQNLPSRRLLRSLRQGESRLNRGGPEGRRSPFGEKSRGGEGILGFVPSDLVVEFCKDVQRRSQATFQNGDLSHCETTFEKMGRTAQVYNGLTQLGFEQLNHQFSFQSEQTQVSLYLSAVYSLSGLVGKPSFKVNPAKGLVVTLTGSGTNGAMPTTLSPTILNVIWRCEIARSSLYEVNILIPVEGYDPVEFTLTIECGHTQEKESNPMRGWATFGIISCIFIVLSSLLCCGGFIYKTNVEHQSGLYALPGMTILSAFLDAVGGPSYVRADDHGGSHASQASWERMPGTSQAAAHGTKDIRYGSL
uniref:Uncharacterized protein n=1 Tax=Oryza punctata TaxID=4537 RepID=A0A0E0JGP7_ORYPU